MLTKLLIKNFTITEKVDIDWKSGMTTISGETGAGKSIMLNALKIVLGDKASPDKIKEGSEKCEILAVFDISNNPITLSLLEDLGLNDEESPNELMIRRVITKSGSKSYINDTTVKITSVKNVTKDLIDIHSQSAHHNLLNKDHQLLLLDEYANVVPLKHKVMQCAKDVRGKEKSLSELIESKKMNNDKIELLTYQLKEFEEIDLKDGEVEELDSLYNKMENSIQYKDSLLNATNLLFDDDTTIIDQLNNIQSNLPELNELANVKELLSQALISLEETKSDISSTLDSFDINEEDRSEINNRMAQVNSLSKKHKVMPEELFKERQEIEKSLELLNVSDDDIVDLEECIKDAKKCYHINAKELSDAREKSSKNLSEKVSKNIEKLKISSNAFRVDIHKEDKIINNNGYETIEFMFCPNPGNPFGSLSKIASGGELSRVSLAIQLALAEISNFNTLMFDEVDVGIGGSTAAVVGTMLRNLGAKGQVICITHQPQVASQGHEHLEVFKTIVDQKTHHGMKYLIGKEREKEIARMLASHKITEVTYQLARDMLKN
jgi:DNA repair protein RecN (Recombination protein N)